MLFKIIMGNLDAFVIVKYKSVHLSKIKITVPRSNVIVPK